MKTKSIFGCYVVERKILLYMVAYNESVFLLNSEANTEDRI